MRSTLRTVERAPDLPAAPVDLGLRVLVPAALRVLLFGCNTSFQPGARHMRRLTRPSPLTPHRDLRNGRSAVRTPDSVVRSQAPESRAWGVGLLLLNCGCVCVCACVR
jgi:hypothetical protein